MSKLIRDFIRNAAHGKSKSLSHKNKRLRKIERLEDRQLMAADFGTSGVNHGEVSFEEEAATVETALFDSPAELPEPDPPVGIRGDFDGDAIVDGADFLAWQRDSRIGDRSSGYTAWRETYGDVVQPVDDPSNLIPGEELLPGQSIQSGDGRYSLVLQGDGNLVLYDTAAASDLWSATAMWATNTAGKNVTHAIMQHDGNFVLYDGAEKVWATDTHGNDGAHLRIQNDGNVVIYAADGEEAIWSTGTEGIPALSSNPGAPHTLYLDFDGHHESTWLNIFQYNDIDTPPYDTDSNPGALSDAEKWEIREIFERVAEDFAPFNVNVTTIDPGGYNGNDTTNTDNIVRVAIGGTSDWYGSAWGVAPQGAYSNPLIDNLVFAFSEEMTLPRQVANVISQEAGHAYGLRHQSCHDASGDWQEYCPGDGTRAPIMGGAAGSSARSLWWHGENEKGKTQNDVAKLADKLGRRPDREGNDFASAAQLGSSAKYFDDYAVIGKHSDVDYFRFSIDSWSEAMVRVNVLDLNVLTGAGTPGANLDARIELYTSGGELIVSFDDPNDLSASVPQTLSPGEYYVAVRSAGNYGDLGRYTVSAEFTETDPIYPPDSPSRLIAGEELLLGQEIHSGDGRFTLRLQTDGNLVLKYASTGAVLWSSGTHDQGVTRAVMQTDGNFVLRDSADEAVWSTGTHGHPNAYLDLQNDGNAVVVSMQGNALWATDTAWANEIPTDGPSRLILGEGLLPGQEIHSGDGRFTLRLQTDGNLVLTYASTGAVLWSSGTHDQGVTRAVMETNGNFLLYAGSTKVWSTGTQGHLGTYLDLQSDGNVVVRATSGSALWRTDTAWADDIPADTPSNLTMAEELAPGESIQSSNGRFRLRLQTDGNLVLYDDEAGPAALWATGTDGVNVTRAVMQGDGNFVLYAGANPVWATDTQGQPGAYLVLQNDGNLVTYNLGGTSIWSTGTVVESSPPIITRRLDPYLRDLANGQIADPVFTDVQVSPSSSTVTSPPTADYVMPATTETTAETSVIDGGLVQTKATDDDNEFKSLDEAFATLAEPLAFAV